MGVALYQGAILGEELQELVLHLISLVAKTLHCIYSILHDHLGLFVPTTHTTPRVMTGLFHLWHSLLLGRLCSLLTLTPMSSPHSVTSFLALFITMSN